jgi:hypothetical protein
VRTPGVGCQNRANSWRHLLQNATRGAWPWPPRQAAGAEGCALGPRPPVREVDKKAGSRVRLVERNPMHRIERHGRCRVPNIAAKCRRLLQSGDRRQFACSLLRQSAGPSHRLRFGTDQRPKCAHDPRMCHVEPFTDRLQQGLDKAADVVVALIGISSPALVLVHVDVLMTSTPSRILSPHWMISERSELSYLIANPSPRERKMLCRPHRRVAQGLQDATRFSKRVVSLLASIKISLSRR